MARESYGWKALGLTAAFHAACLALATYPTVLTMGSTVPDRADTLAEVWVLRYYRACLAEGTSIAFCPDIQYPVGVPFVNYSPLHAQALLYLPLSALLRNDALCFNLIWAFGLLLTGLGTSLLAWRAVGDRRCAAFGGLVAMLSAPLLCHAQRGHAELVFVGSIPLFLIAWMRFVDRPGRAALALVSAAYVATAMSAAYYMIFAIFPAVLYLAWEAVKARSWTWVRGRIPWLVGMVALTLPCIVGLFASHLWAVANGYGAGRSRDEFDSYAVSLLGYLTPSPRNLLSSWLPANPAAINADNPPYLGVVTLVLLGYAALVRRGTKKAAFWWSALALMVVLSLGSTATIGTHSITLPAGWLWAVFPPLRMTRCPSRFSMVAAVFAAVIAAGALRTLLARCPGRRTKAALFALATVAMVADLSNAPFSREPLPKLPRGYAFIRERNPKAKILEVPSLGSGGSILNLSCLYWQSLHRLTTSGGSSGRHNDRLDRLITDGSPLKGDRLANPGYLADPAKLNVDLTTGLEFEGYFWVYLTHHGFDYAVLHQWEGATPGVPVRLDRAKALLAGARVYEDADTVVYARDRLRPPTRPVVFFPPEWPRREIHRDRWSATLPERSELLVYNPDPQLEIVLQMDAAAIGAGRTACVRDGAHELARWRIAPGDYQSEYTPPFRLPAGFRTLTLAIEEDDWTRPADEADRVRVAHVVAFPASWLGPVAAKPAETSRK